jgi:hypothetical protein
MGHSVDELSGIAKTLAYEFIDRLRMKGIEYQIRETYRPQIIQDAYYAQGREPLEKVNDLRARAGLYLLGAEEGKRIITKAKTSKHTERMAIDIVPVLSTGKIPWVVKDATVAAIWLELGELGESVGFEWGGRWTPLDAWGLGWDLPHYQVKI